MSSTECLNLNITVPPLASVANTVLPVMVFIHGGGFIMGANSWPQYDPARLVRMSADLGSPLIVVNVNYRLGGPGNLTSEELRNAGYPGNNSLRDQRCALQWVRKHIGGFGGNADNITVFGESAGAGSLSLLFFLISCGNSKQIESRLTKWSVSVLHQLGFEEPLFRRAISMSGTPLMLKPLSLSSAETSYNAVMQALGLEHASTQERIQRLLSMSPEELVEKTPMNIPLVPYIDDDMISEAHSFAQLSSGTLQSLKSSWCEELLIGSCAHDGNVFFFMGLSLPGIASAIHASFSRNLPSSVAHTVLSAYGITSSMRDEEAMVSIIDLATDIAYHLPAQYYARAFKGKVSSYLFTEPNPWDGMFKGRSTHMLDAAFLFQNFDENLSDEAKITARGLGADFVAFAYGRAGSGWERGETKVYGPETDGQHRLEILSREGKVDLDALSAAWDLFLSGK
jgi:carboxylesterase type B